MSTNPRSRFGILSPEILSASEVLPLISTMTLDELITVVGKLRSLEVILPTSCTRTGGTRTI